MSLSGNVYTLSTVTWMCLIGVENFIYISYFILFVLYRAIAELYLQLASCQDSMSEDGPSRDVKMSRVDKERECVTYFACKRHDVHIEYRRKREAFLACPTFSGWIVDDPEITEAFDVYNGTHV